MTLSQPLPARDISRRTSRLSITARPLRSLGACLLCLAMLALFSPPSVQASSPLSYLTEEYYPFNYTENGELKGISTDILHLVWAELGEPAQPIQVLPWARAYDRACNNRNTVLFSMARIPEREKLFRWVGPIAGTRFVLIAKKSAGITLRSLDEAAGYRIGTLRDDVTDLLLQKYCKRNKIEAVADMQHNIRKLLSGRLDMVAYEETSWRQIALKNSLSPDDYETVLVLHETLVYFAFHKDTPPLLLKDFQDALDRVKTTPAYQKILNTYLH